jgi:hypothetical protein
LLEYNDKQTSWYVDIDISEYEMDTNLSFSGSADSFNMWGDYSFTIPSRTQVQGPMDLVNGVKVSWTMNSSQIWWITNLSMKNIFGEQWKGPHGILDIDMSNDHKDDINIWNMEWTWELNTWEEWANPMKGTLEMKWNILQNDSKAKVNYEL